MRGFSIRQADGDLRRADSWSAEMGGRLHPRIPTVQGSGGLHRVWHPGRLLQGALMPRSSSLADQWQEAPLFASSIQAKRNSSFVVFVSDFTFAASQPARLQEFRAARVPIQKPPHGRRPRRPRLRFGQTRQALRPLHQLLP